MTYQDQLEEQSASVTDQVAAALAMYAAGALSAAALVAVVAAYVSAANSAAAALADLSLAAAVTTATGTPTAPRGITRPSTDPDRLTRAAQTILDDLTAAPADAYDDALAAAQTRFERLADAEAKEAAALAYSEAVATTPEVTGWTRGLKADACQLCRWWWREGRLWEPDHPMPTHKGCTCSQLITTERKPA